MTEAIWMLDGSANISVVDREGEVHRLTWAADQTLMELLRENDLPILATCGGCCACATCHVLIGPEWFGKFPPRSDDEIGLLQDAEAFEEEASRLACQLTFSEELDGLVVRLAEEE